MAHKRGAVSGPLAVETMDRRRTIKANGPVRLDRLAESLLDPVVSRAGFSSTQILTAWPDIVGPALAARSRPEKLRWPARRDEECGDGATLFVRAEGGDALELQYASAEIVARINAMFGWRAVERISIRQAPVDDVATGPGPETRAEGFAEPDSGPDAGYLADIADDDLRAALGRLGARIGKGRDTKP